MRTLVYAIPSRRSFLAQSGLGALALALGCTPEAKVGDTGGGPRDTGGTPDSGGETGLDTSGGTGGDTSGAEDPWGELPTDCAAPSVDTGTGPFYRDGAPERTELNAFDEDGTPIRVYFRVVDTTCAPLAGVLVEVWHCAPEAQYDMTSDDMRFYGKQTTDAQGRGFIQTIKPPTYVDDAGEHDPHIHLQMTVDGYDSIALKLLFREDDPDPREADPVLELVEDGEGYWVDNVVFVLEVEGAEEG